MYSTLSDRPVEDQALAVNELIETYLSREARLLLRNHTYVEREGYVAVRFAIGELREKFWTAENWLELRLCKYIATGVFRVGHKLFSMLQNDDGVWQKQTLVPSPKNMNRARQDHIYGPLPVPSPFRHPSSVAEAQEELLKDHPFDISKDGIAASIDPWQAANLAVRKAVQNNNLEPPNASRTFRVQFLADAVGYFRGKRQVTRAGVRIPNLKEQHNSKHYATNVSLFLGSDHFEELDTQLGPVYTKLNAGMRTAPAGRDEVGNEQFSAALFTEKVTCAGCGEAEIIDGGDAACANASAGLEPPPSRQGCCCYCESRRVDWFDAAKCKKATPRTLFRSCLMAHRLPPGAPADASYRCPGKGCKHIITKESEAQELAKQKAMTPAQLSKHDLKHRNAHAGQNWLKRKLLWLDHLKRAPSLLHMMLNAVSTTLTCGYKAGATKEEIQKMNAVFVKYDCLYEFKTKKGERDTKATGNECRKILWTKGLLLDLVEARCRRLLLGSVRHRGTWQQHSSRARTQVFVTLATTMTPPLHRPRRPSSTRRRLQSM